MIFFKMVKYHNKEYPTYIPLNIEEVAGHFDISEIRVNMPYSLHTEYSYGKRLYKNEHLSKYKSISNANKDGIPMLWHSEQWVEDFAKFVIEITKNLEPPSVIEIHPPFSDYCEMSEFISRYERFENIVLSAYPNARILIENRYGSLYRGGRFIICSMQSLIELSEMIAKSNLKLRITLDIPQLFTAHNVCKVSGKEISEIFMDLLPIRDNIGGLHLWGKRPSNSKRPIAHCGDLSSLFGYDKHLKWEFLNNFSTVFDDDKERLLVLEVNSANEDVFSIIQDLETVDCKFI